ncbi:MAG: hypothetical protein WA418_21435 [Bradyrhizobium sp.]
MTLKVPVHYIEIAGTRREPDRVEFWRDMEACTRAHSPMASIRMAHSLIRHRVRFELVSGASMMTQAEAYRREPELIRELWYGAVERGLMSPSILGIEILMERQL